LLFGLLLCFSVNIEILSVGGLNLSIAPQFPRTLPLIFSHGNHYDCVYTQRQMAVEEMCQNVVLELVSKAIDLPEDLPTSYRNIGLEVYKRGQKCMATNLQSTSRQPTPI
jgi:hypothetical protein